MSRRCTGIPEFRLRLDQERCIRGHDQTLTRPDTAVEIMRKLAGDDAQESFIAVYIDARNGILGTHRVSLGGYTNTSVDPKVLFSGAILSGASALIVGHNHPSGSVDPSREDDELTQMLISGAKTLSLRLLDHIVFSAHDYYSYVAHGRLKFS